MATHLRAETFDGAASLDSAGSESDEGSMRRKSNKGQHYMIPGIGSVRCQPAPTDPSTLPRQGAASFYVLSSTLAFGLFKTFERACQVKVALERAEGVRTEIVERTATPPRVCHLLR